VRSAERLRPPGLLQPNFVPDSPLPALPAPAQLGTHEYSKLQKVIQGASGALPGDQDILRCIRTASQMAKDALHDTDSGACEELCVTRMRTVLQFVMDAREKCAWGDYVRPSHQHVEGPDISTFHNMLDIDRSLSKEESRELEQLAKQQDMMQDPLGLATFKEKNLTEVAGLQADLDAQITEVQEVYVPTFNNYQCALDQLIETIRSLKNARIKDEIEAGISAKERELIAQKGELQALQQRIARTLKDVNELQVQKKEVHMSLISDEKAHTAATEGVQEKLQQLACFEATLQKRKQATEAVGRMEESVVSHIQELLLERGQDLFEGKSSMLMRQYEVLPNVYCQCAILEGL